MGRRRRGGGLEEEGRREGIGSFQRPISSLHDSGDSPFSVMAGFFFFYETSSPLVFLV